MLKEFRFKGRIWVPGSLVNRPVPQTTSGTICLAIGEYKSRAEKDKHAHLGGLLTIKRISVANWVTRPRRATIG